MFCTGIELGWPISTSVLMTIWCSSTVGKKPAKQLIAPMLNIVCELEREVWENTWSGVELCLYDWAQCNCFREIRRRMRESVRDRFNNQDQPGAVFLCSRGLPQPLLIHVVYWINEPVELDRCMRRNSVWNKNKINTMNSNWYKLLIQILIYGSNPYNKYMNDSNTPLKLKLNKIVTRKQCLFLQNMELSPNYHKLPLGWVTTGREGATNMIHMWKKKVNGISCFWCLCNHIVTSVAAG